MSKKERNFSILSGLQPVISLEIEQNHYFPVILKIKSLIVLLQISSSGWFRN